MAARLSKVPTGPRQYVDPRSPLPSSASQTHRPSPQHSPTAKIPEFAPIQRSRWLSPYPAFRWQARPLQGPQQQQPHRKSTLDSNRFPTWTPLERVRRLSGGQHNNRYPLSLARFVRPSLSFPNRTNTRSQTMEDPDDPCWSWPHWKFGLKREDLFTKLHEQYNTIPSSIQDPEAFHHDVYEISHEATSTDDFHRLLQDRKEQRLRELNESLESAAFEIIANPSLIGTDQWQYAVQLFRTKSLDSLVRYFASYLPSNHPWHKSASSSVSDISSSADSLAISHGSFFDDDGPIMTDEPLELESSSCNVVLPPSPRSMTTCSESLVNSPMDIPHLEYDLNTLTPPHTLSYSESEPDFQDEDTSQPCDADLPATPASAASVVVGHHVDSKIDVTSAFAHETETPCMFSSLDIADSETPTPKPERQLASFFESKPSLPHRRHRSLSPSRPLPLSRCEAETRDPRNTSSLMQAPSHKRLVCATVRRSRRNRGEPAMCIRKPSPNGLRTRTRERKRDCS